LGAVLAVVPMFAAFEAHVVNVTARIENALFVHPAEIAYGTVFPQEHLWSDFFLSFSESFSAGDQTRVGTVEYVIKQKPKPRAEYVAAVGVEAARDYCHLTDPVDAGNLNDPYYANCYPNLCPYLSKHEMTPDGGNPLNPLENDGPAIPPFHDPDNPASWAVGKIVKLPAIGRDSSDDWYIDLAVPCFKGHCAQDWASFVTGLNPNVVNPNEYQLPASLEHEVFGCDLWVEVTDIY